MADMANINNASVAAGGGSSSGGYNNNVLIHGVDGNVNVNAGVDVGGNSLRDICSFLQPLNATAENSCPYDHIVEMIQGLDLQDDGILMSRKIKAIETDFCNIVCDEVMLCESMEYINDKALEDGQTALKFALLFSSRNFDALAMKETKVRTAMLKILETNFLNADIYRIQDKDRLYNSITLLGEYYHRVRLADNSPIDILGESLIGLLLRELSEAEIINLKLAKLVLSQITLNGDTMRPKHKEQLTQLLYHVRRHLIEQSTLAPAVKALLLMTLDLYYSNFKNLGKQLEEMYTKYLVQDDQDEDNNNVKQQELAPQQNYHFHQQEPPQTLQQSHEQHNHTEQHNNSYNNGEEEEEDINPYGMPISTKKWSDQVCEEFFNESEFDNRYNYNDEPNQICGTQQQQNEDSLSQDRHSSSHNSRQSHQGHDSSHSGNQNQHSKERRDSMGEEFDQTKPLPRWRTPRFNRDSIDNQNNRQRNRQQQNYRRFSGSFEDDRHSVRSEGGSIRLYSINDRLKHSQEKIERSSNSQYSSIANSNWDRQSQRDDRSERSNFSNYERGNHSRRGNNNRNFNQRQMYDKPPRFQKHQQQLQQMHQNKEYKIQSDSWRRSYGNAVGFSNGPEECPPYPPNNGPDSGYHGAGRARTLPRPSKAHLDHEGQTYERHSQSPSQGNVEPRGHPNRPRNPNPRYSSQSSLASEESNTLERRQHYKHPPTQRRRSFGRRQEANPNWQNTHKERTEEIREEDRTDVEELVRNARKTTNYMNYLSAKK